MVDFSQNKEISEVLAGFGLHDTDQRVYLAALPLGQTNLVPLAQAASLPLTTVQSIAQRLERRGFFLVSKKGSRSTYEAADPAMLEQILSRQTRDLKAITPLLASLKEHKGGEAGIRVYRGERMRDIFYEILNSREKIVYEIVSAKDIQAIMGEKLHFSRRRVEKGIHLKSLRIENKEIKKYSPRIHAKELREARFLPKELAFKTSIILWGTSIAYFTTYEEGLAWTVQSNAMAESFKQLFNLLWMISRPMITLKE